MVVWRSEKIPNGDPETGMSDLYLQCWLATDPTDVQKTDTHLRCQNGNGRWGHDAAVGAWLLDGALSQSMCGLLSGDRHQG
jgi:hypothetical protein